MSIVDDVTELLPTPGASHHVWGTRVNAIALLLADLIGAGDANLLEEILEDRDRLNRVAPAAIGADGQVLGIVGGLPAFIPPPSGRVFDVDDYGGDPTGVADSSAAFQAAIDAAHAAGGGSVVFEGKYRAHSLNLTQATMTGIWIQGGGQGTVITVPQNEELFNINGDNHHSCAFRDFAVTWEGTTTSAHTNAIVFKYGAGSGSKSQYMCLFANLTCSNGYRVWDSNAGMLFWGNRIVNVTVTNWHGGIFRLTGTAGQPINSFIGLYVNAQFCTQTLLIGNALVATFVGFEVNLVNLGVAILSDGGAGDYTFLGETSIELGVWASNVELFSVSDSQLHIQKLKLEGMCTARVRVFYTANTGSVTCDRFHIGIVPSGASGHVFFAHVGASGNSNIADPQLYAINGRVVLGKVRFYGGLKDTTTGLSGYRRSPNYVALTDMGSTGASDAVQVREWLDPSRVDYAGNAAYTVPVGGPARVIFNTALTANRDVSLPHTDYLFSGYRVAVSKNVTGGDVVVKTSGGTTIHTIPAATKGWVEVTYNRSIGDGPSLGWSVTAGGTWT